MYYGFHFFGFFNPIVVCLYCHISMIRLTLSPSTSFAMIMQISILIVRMLLWSRS
jgi:hypothetical protein